MTFEFTSETISHISGILGVEARHYGNHYRFEIRGDDPVKQVVLEIYPRIPIGETEGALISVFTPNSHLQLQQCSGVVISEMLGEVTFIAEAGKKLSGLIVEKQGGCSMYSNVDRALLSGDMTRLGPEIMMSSIALAMTELILPEEFGDEQPPSGHE